MSIVLEVTDLSKTYRSNFLFHSFRALKGISLSIENGEIHGFLGPNGAGKTTTIKCIIGLITPDEGMIRINGESALSVSSRRRIGFMPENPYFYDYLTALELMIFNGRLLGISASELKEKSLLLLDRVGLKGKERIKLKKYSKGMLQRIGFAQAMLQDPDLLILDEPFSGLDPIGRKELRDIIFAEKEKGKTIFFSSHILPDVEMIADRVSIIWDGRIIKAGKIDELLSKTVQYHEIVCSEISTKRLSEIYFDYSERNGTHVLRVLEELKINEIIESIIHNGGRIRSVTPVKLTLEDIFMREFKEEQ